MVIVNKIVVMDEKFNHTEVPALGEFYNYFSYWMGYEAFLLDTETGETAHVGSNEFMRFIDKLRAYNPYGLVENGAFKEVNGYTMYYVIAVDKPVVNFLDCVESATVMRKIDCSVNTIDLSVVGPVGMMKSLDDLNTFFSVDFDLPNKDPLVTTYISLFDAVCLMDDGWREDGFYLPIVADEFAKGSHVLRIEFTDMVRAKRLVTRSRVLRPNLLNDIYDASIKDRI